MHTFPTISYLCSRLGHRRARDVSCIDAPFWYVLWPHCPSPWCNQPNNQRITIRGDLAHVCHPNIAENPVLASRCSPSEDTWEEFFSSLRAGNGWASPQLRFPLKGCGSGDAHILHYPQTRWCKTIIYDAQGVCGPGNPPGHSGVSCLGSPSLGSQRGVGILCELVPLMLALAATLVGAVSWNLCMWLLPVARDSAHVLAGSLVWENP